MLCARQPDVVTCQLHNRVRRVRTAHTPGIYRVCRRAPLTATRSAVDGAHEHAPVAAKDDPGFVALVDGAQSGAGETVSYRIQACLSASKALLRRVSTRGLIGTAAITGAVMTFPPKTPC